MISSPRMPIVRIVLVLVAALVAASALYMYHRRCKIQDLQGRFHRAGETDGAWLAFPPKTVEVLGYRAGMRFLCEMAAKYDVFDFDGQSRFCQIYRDFQDYGDVGQPSDAVVLTLVAPRNGKYLYLSYYWYGPPGATIETVEIIEGDVRVRYVLYSDRKNGEQKKDAVCRTSLIPWKPFEKPTAGIFDGVNAVVVPTENSIQP